MDWFMSMIFYSAKADAKPLLYFSAIAGAAFGSIHCAAWDFEFPSHVEQVMWRTASLTLVGVCLSVFAGQSICSFFILFYHKAEVGTTSKKVFRVLIEYKYLALIPSILYSISRLVLLILALLSLRHLSHSALQTVTWTRFIPHI